MGEHVASEPKRGVRERQRDGGVAMIYPYLRRLPGSLVEMGVGIASCLLAVYLRMHGLGIRLLTLHLVPDKPI